MAKRDIPGRPFGYVASKVNSPRGGGKALALHCGKVSIEALAKDFGTPLYVYSADSLLERMKLFAEAFSALPHTVCYAVKANSNLSILSLLASQGAGFDIVSGGELERVARSAPTALGKVVFSGVGKTADEMDAAIRANILIFNVESVGEVELLAHRAQKLKKKVRVALRVNPDVFAETHPYISTGLREHKFGIDIRKARPIYRRIAADPFLEPAGISVHIGSQISSPKPFGAALDRVAKLISELRLDGIVVQYVDAGGGLGVEYNTERSFDPRSKLKAYAMEVERALNGLNIHLLLEPGRFLIAQAALLLTRVLYVKKNGTKTFVITDAGMNDLIRPALYQAHHAIIPVRSKGGRKRPVDVVGPVCETGDFFARDRLLESVAPGDLVAILDVGAYGMSLSSNYNTRCRPAEVLLEGNRVRLVRRRETVRDLLEPEMLVPPKLKSKSLEPAKSESKTREK